MELTGKDEISNELLGRVLQSIDPPNVFGSTRNGLAPGYEPASYPARGFSSAKSAGSFQDILNVLNYFTMSDFLGLIFYSSLAWL